MPPEQLCTLGIISNRYEPHGRTEFPPLRMCVPHPAAVFTAERASPEMFHFSVEEARGYSANGAFWRPGTFSIDFARDSALTFSASIEPWETFTAQPAKRRFTKSRAVASVSTSALCCGRATASLPNSCSPRTRQATACSGPCGGRLVRCRPFACLGSKTIFVRRAVRGGRRTIFLPRCAVAGART
ncbi:MAG: glycogen debranching protein [Betaproteobacteria bacterium]|jgi:hypothetical protein|nr:glycogen debranching protein [Betaproteobacteria bacterium]